MQTVGAAWLMVSLNAGPMYVALTQTASALPFFVFALPAGALGDIVDRRKLILYTETWMAGVALVLTILAMTGFISPLPLLILTFALSAGDAFETPTWRALLPELVTKEDLSAASALNGIEFNLARAIGPGLAGLGHCRGRRWRRIPAKHYFVHRRHLRRRTLEASDSQADYTARNRQGRNDSGHPLRPLLTSHHHFADSLGTGNVLCERAPRPPAIPGSHS
jgi:hypothetical protein